MRSERSRRLHPERTVGAGGVGELADRTDVYSDV